MRNTPDRQTRMNMAEARRAGSPHPPLMWLVVGGIVAVALALIGWSIASTPSTLPLGSGSTPGAGSPGRSAPVATPSAAALASLRPPRGTQASPAPSASMPAPSQPVATQPLGVREPFFPGGLLIADRNSGRLLVVDDAGNILWRFPVAGSLPPGQTFSADDAFVAPDGQTIVSNEESNQVIVRIDIATEQIVWQYGTFGIHGSAPGQLWEPDDAYPLANGDITVADIKNCRILEISAAKQIVRQWGRTRLCHDNPPRSFGSPNGDTPLPDGGMLVTEIDGSRVVRLSSTGSVIFNIHVPTHYPSDAQLLPDGNVLVVDYANPGAVLVVDPSTGAVVYRYFVAAGSGRLDHPSLAAPLADGSFVVNDDDRARVVVIDPQTNAIVWSYGHIDQPGSADGFLNLPDGVDVVPPGIFN